jgi:hypothetical protein
MMLWWKSWMETRWRLVFLLAFFALLWAEGPLSGLPMAKLRAALLVQYAAIWMFAATMLSGAGLNSQTVWGVTTGYHGSMLFTLSLPVARRRLFAVRAATGAVETFALIVLSALPLIRFTGLSWSVAPLFIGGACICSMAAYAVSALLACVTGEMWQLYGSWGVLGALALLLRWPTLARFDPLSGFSLAAYTAARSAPWRDAWIASVLLAAVCCFVSVRILERKEY